MDTKVSSLIVCLIAGHVTGLNTIPSVHENGGNATLAVPENAPNVTIFCEVTNTNNATSATLWFLIDITTNMRQQIFNNDNPLFSIGTAPFMTLTIVSFAQSLIGTKIECTNNLVPGLQVAFFILRFIEPPVLMRSSIPLISVEGSSFSHTNIQQSPGFPLLPSYQWFHDGVAINTDTSTNPNVSVYPNIVFSSVERTQSGNYSMTASTEGGDSTGYFILDVLAPPDGTLGPNEVFGVTGMDSTITAFTGITGNPTPNSKWTRDGVLLTSGRMYNTDNTGVLVISNVMLSDTGNYTNTLHNMFNNESFTTNFTISLQVLSPPSPPQSVSAINITSNSVVLWWLNPVSVGVPTAFVRFSIELATTSKVLLMSTNAVNNVSSFTNTLTVTGLDPNTNYTISIRTVSTHPAVGDLVSDSIMQAITTNASVPQFKQSILYNNDGRLELEWSLRHTGGLPLNSISVTCSGGNSTTLRNRSVCTLDMCGDDGSTRLGPVMAGSSYTCSVTASNTVGSTTSDTNTVITLTGIPSIPVISVSVGGQVRLQVTTAYAGVVAGDNSLHFNVSVYNTTSSGPKLLYQISLYPLLRSDFLGTSVLLNHNLSLQPGSYQFSARACNRYGSSPESRLTTAVSTLLQSSTDSPVTVIAITVCVISVVIVVIAVSVLITVVICIMRRHAGKNIVKSTTTSSTTQHPVALQHVQTVENESYGVLGGDVPQSIELKENAAYSTVKPPSAPIQSIAVNSNVAYGLTPKNSY